MTLVHRVLYPKPISSLDEYLARGGGAGLEAARDHTADSLVAELKASGLRGRGGAGFPTGVKWATVREYQSPDLATTVIVNGAEGEPGTFKDRTILARSPYEVIEGALIAAQVVEANEIIFGLKKSFGPVVRRLQAAIDEVVAAGWTEGLTLRIFQGPNEYLYGEETALLETIEGRYPFPRVSPPYRRGEVEVVGTDADARSGSGLSAHVDMADASGETGAPPALIDNVETMANIPRIIARGAKWFRTEGTEKSPGTIVCTITGDVQREGVGEVIMGTTLRATIDAISGGPRPGRRIKAVLVGVSSSVITADQLDTPLSYEDMAAAGSGLGSGGYMVFDDHADMTAVAAGVSRFLAVESCGQCTPCKLDGMELSDKFEKLCASDASRADFERIRHLIDTVGERARCSLATQHQTVVGSILASFGADVEGHLSGSAGAVEPRLVAELEDIEGDEAVWDERHRQKQPDWTYTDEWHGKVPAEMYGDHRHQVQLPE
ncbi:MAG: NADH-quinone oxidoreductase subunit [Acidimicrobiaceae bacterium]|jgi:NADH:ubiquinone oxidoreductase subunit F (NADH-binding)|nr:NADH-quinone oxidoreductase subunit [Acidimicrobiaceae bacterium]MDQ1400904.1 NADH-quinone oxidoreductase subunit [Acidimicrobiaceae bacterium]MDQ1416594.1 NADH-quinone oxidoreductase subunit [Acidimicrobiaceae bacterium]MDQ1419817.1 NADH-quinone oxidoreductase subunit [Acidimicrobiaceae bacterium]